MNTLNKTLLLALVAQVLIFAGVRFAGRADDRAPPRPVLPGLDPAAITRVEIWGPPKEGDGPDQEKVALAREGGQWGVADADGYPADGKKVDELLAALAKLTTRSQVVTGSTYHSKLEVAEGKFQRKVTLTAGGKARTLFLGSSPAWKSVHVRVEGEDPVYLVGDLATGDVGSRAWAWVERGYLKHGPESVWSVKLTNARGTIELERSPAGGDWAVLGSAEPVARSAVEDLVRKAGTINLETPVGKEVRPEHGLASPLATVTLVTGTSTVAGAPPPRTETVTVQVGAKLEAENQYFVKASSSPYVVRVAAWAVEPLIGKAREDLAEKPAAPPAPAP
jgi:hypothetical protein